MEGNHYEKGLYLFELKKYNDAITSFQEHLNYNAEDIDAMYNLSLCYFYKDDIGKSEKLLHSIFKIDANYSNAHYLYSNLLFQENKTLKALKQINIAIELNPINSSFFGLKSLILIRKKDFKNALITSKLGLEINATDVLCLNSRTTALTKLKRKKEAYSTIETTLNEDPENEYTHANIGWSNLELGNYKKALNHFKESLKIDPNFEYARQGMVEAIKSKNFIYRMFMKYAFWMQNKSSKNQWIFIIGIYLAYRFAHKLLEASEIAYIAPILLGLYLVFALGSWLISPISNGILLFNNYGKYLLDKRDKLSGISFNILISISAIFILLFYFYNNNLFLGISLSALFTIIPLAHSINIDNKKSQLIGVSYGFLMLIIGVYGSLSYNDLTFPLGIVFFMMIIYTWLSNVLKE